MLQKGRMCGKGTHEELLTIVSVASVSEQEIENALTLEWSDFEDSVQYSVAYYF